MFGFEGVQIGKGGKGEQAVETDSQVSRLSGRVSGVALYGVEILGRSMFGRGNEKFRSEVHEDLSSGHRKETYMYMYLEVY